VIENTIGIEAVARRTAPTVTAPIAVFRRSSMLMFRNHQV
jgi:hypothetical protein